VKSARQIISAENVDMITVLFSVSFSFSLSTLVLASESLGESVASFPLQVRHWIKKERGSVVDSLWLASVLSLLFSALTPLVVDP